MNTCIGIKVGDANKIYSRGDVMEAEKGKTLRFYKNIMEAVLYSDLIDPVSLEPRMFYEVAAQDAKESSLTAHIMEDRWLFVTDTFGIVGALFDCCRDLEDDPDTMMFDKPPAEADISNLHVFNVGKSSKTYAGSLAIVCNGRKGASLNADVDYGVLISAELTNFRSYGNDTKIIALEESSRITAHGCRNVVINMADDAEITNHGIFSLKLWKNDGGCTFFVTGYDPQAAYPAPVPDKAPAQELTEVPRRLRPVLEQFARKIQAGKRIRGSSRFSLGNFHTLKSLRG